MEPGPALLDYIKSLCPCPTPGAASEKPTTSDCVIILQPLGVHRALLCFFVLRAARATPTLRAPLQRSAARAAF